MATTHPASPSPGASSTGPRDPGPRPAGAGSRGTRRGPWPRSPGRRGTPGGQDLRLGVIVGHEHHAGRDVFEETARQGRHQVLRRDAAGPPGPDPRVIRQGPLMSSRGRGPAGRRGQGSGDQIRDATSRARALPTDGQPEATPRTRTGTRETVLSARPGRARRTLPGCNPPPGALPASPRAGIAQPPDVLERTPGIERARFTRGRNGPGGIARWQVDHRESFSPDACDRPGTGLFRMISGDSAAWNPRVGRLAGVAPATSSVLVHLPAPHRRGQDAG